MHTTFADWPLAFRFPAGWIGTDLQQAANGDYLACLMNGIDVAVWRSTDGGATFSLLSTPFSGGYSHGYLVANGSDLFCSAKNTSGSTLYVRRSTDGGATWGTASTIASGTGMGDPALAYGGGRLWCCHYSVSAKRVDVKHSSDNGATWTACTSPMSLGFGTVEDTSIVVLPSGRIVAAWEWEYAEKGASQLWSAYTDDLGVTWKLVPLPCFDGADNEGGHLSLDGEVLRYLFGSNALRRSVPGYDGIDLFHAISLDSGATWSEAYRFGQWPLIEPSGSIDFMIGTSDYDPAGVMGERQCYAFQPIPQTDVMLDGGCGMAVMRSGEKVLEFSGTNPIAQRGHLLGMGDGNRVEAELLSDAAEVDLRLVGRYRDRDNHYLGLILKTASSQQAIIYRCYQGVYSALATGPASVNQGTWYKMRLECVGVEIRLYVNDSLVLTATDATHTYGKGGISTAYPAARNPVYCRWLKVG